MHGSHQVVVVVICVCNTMAIARMAWQGLRIEIWLSWIDRTECAHTWENKSKDGSGAVISQRKRNSNWELKHTAEK